MATEKRLIYLDDAKEALTGWDTDPTDEEIEYTLDCLPKVDAVEVVHAEWLDIRFDSMWRSMLATCSHCKVRGEVRVKSNECGFAVPDSDYCHHCGAKMDGERRTHERKAD